VNACLPCGWSRCATRRESIGSDRCSARGSRRDYAAALRWGPAPSILP